MLEASHGDSFWYLDTQYFVDIEKHSKALEIIKKDFFQSNESFIKTYQQKYTLPILTKSHNTIYNLPPTWMFNEISSFGLFSSIFRNLNKKHQKNIAKVFLLDEVILSSWILSLLTVRNTCAHHARLWNKRLGTAPKNPNKNPFSIQCNNRKIAIILQILIRLLTVIHGPDNPYASQLKAIAINTSPFIQFGMGFTQPLTKNSFQ